MQNKIKDHFRKTDPILFEVFEKITLEIENPKDPSEYFIALCESIISQQLSIKVADVIFARFKKLFHNEIITPEQILNIKDEEMRSTGMSYAKIKFIKDLADKVTKKEIVLEELTHLSNEEIISKLTTVKGIGPWTAEMFLMFVLKRDDVFSLGDLGLKNAIKKLYKLEQPTQQEMEKISEKWKPYRTYAARILWKSLEL